jgi:hypothetical protein
LRSWCRTYRTPLSQLTPALLVSSRGRPSVPPPRVLTRSLPHLARLNGMLDCGERHRHLRTTCMTLVEQVRKSSKTPLLSCLLEGPSGRWDGKRGTRKLQRTNR